MDDDVVVSGGTGRQLVVGESAALVRKGGDTGRTPFFSQTADAGTAAVVDPAGARASASEPYSLEGLGIDGDTRPAFDAFASAAQEAGLDQNQFTGVANWYKEFQAEQLNELQSHDQEHAGAAIKTLQARWGHEYDANIAAIKGTLSKLPFGDAIMNTRLADGRALFNDPQAVEWFADVAKRLSTPGEKAPMSAEDERAAIEKFMREHRGRYDKDPAMQARYRDVLRQGEPQEAERTGLTDAETRELAGLERFLREHRAAYNKDQAKQARMRELYGKRGY